MPDKEINPFIPVTRKGGDGADKLYGYDADDTLYGSGSNETLLGEGCADTLYGSRGGDKLYGSDGNDTLVSPIMSASGRSIGHRTRPPAAEAMLSRCSASQCMISLMNMREREKTADRGEKSRGGDDRLIAVSLFSGAGGFCDGVRLAGYNVLCAVESDKYACRTHSANFPEASLFKGDIQDFLTFDQPGIPTREDLLGPVNAISDRLWTYGR